MASGETAIEADHGDPGRALAAIEREVESIKRRELAAAVDALEARGDLTDEQRRAIEALADGIAESLLEPPAEALRGAERHDDPRAAAAIRLFDPER